MTLRKELVLGSASPRRSEILTRVGIRHRVVVGSTEEAVLPGEAPLAYLERIVACKLEGVVKALPPDLAAERPSILVADTTVVVDGDILGKPLGAEDARNMIARLAGRTHEVCTRFSVGLWGPGLVSLVAHAETVVTKVRFRDMEPAEIDAYAEDREGADKAGGYAVQGKASGFVIRIEGSYTNVVGLPAAEVIVALRRLGVVP
jgi:septum formation protein